LRIENYCSFDDDSEKFIVSLGCEAVSIAVYILNRIMSNQVKELISYEIWAGKKSNLVHIRIFGSKAFAHIPKNFQKKLDSKARKTLLMRHQRDSTNHKLYDPEISQIFMTRDVTFNEKRSMVKAAIEEEDPGLNLKQVQQAPTEEEEPRTADAIFAVLGSSRSSTKDCKNPHCTKRNAQSVRDLMYQLRDRESIRLPTRYEANL